MIRSLRMLAPACPVCRQRGRHTSFCPRRPGFHHPRPAPLPPIVPILLLVAPFWIGTYLVAGWLGTGPCSSCAAPRSC